MDEVEIIKLSPDRWEEYRDLRLRSLKEDPEAFGILYEDAVKEDEIFWRKLLEIAEKEIDHWKFFAELNGKLVGIVSARITIPAGDGDTVKVQEVFVANEARGKGVGKKLMNYLFKEISKHPQFKKAKIKVFTSQKPAIGMYESVGAKIVDKIEESWPDGRTNETYVMEKTLP